MPVNNIYRLENHSKKAKAVIYWAILKVRLVEWRGVRITATVFRVAAAAVVAVPTVRCQIVGVLFFATIIYGRGGGGGGGASPFFCRRGYHDV